MSSKNQIVVPAEVRRALKLSPGDHLLWRVAYRNDQAKALAEPVPKSWTSAMKGLGKNLWSRVSIAEYIDSLRQEWQPT